MARRTAPPHTRRFSRDSLATIGVIFVSVFAVLYVALLYLTATGRLDWLMEGTAAVAGTLIGWAGMSVVRSGNELLMTNHLLLIDMDCTGAPIAALFIALAVAYPLAARTRLLAIAAGVAAIAVANMVRLFGVAVASETLGPRVFIFVHDYLFKVLMILIVAGMWIVLLQMARAHAPTRS